MKTTNQDHDESAYDESIDDIDLALSRLPRGSLIFIPMGRGIPSKEEWYACGTHTLLKTLVDGLPECERYYQFGEWTPERNDQK